MCTCFEAQGLVNILEQAIFINTLLPTERFELFGLISLPVPVRSVGKILQHLSPRTRLISCFNCLKHILGTHEMLVVGNGKHVCAWGMCHSLSNDKKRDDNRIILVFLTAPISS